MTDTVSAMQVPNSLVVKLSETQCELELANEQIKKLNRELIDAKVQHLKVLREFGEHVMEQNRILKQEVMRCSDGL